MFEPFPSNPDTENKLPPDALPEEVSATDPASGSADNPVTAADPPIALENIQVVGEPIPDGPVFTSMLDYRIDALTRAIDRYPYTPVNYVLRGELYLSRRQIAAAGADFDHALTLAVTTSESELLTWGYLNAALIDRAHDGLREIAHLPPAHRPAEPDSV